MAASFPTSIKSFASVTDGVTTWNASQVDQIHDEIEAIESALMTWTTWTPTVTQSGAVTHSGGYARYTLLGKLVVLTARIIFTGAGTGGNDIVVSGIPAGVQSNRLGGTHGNFRFIDSGTNFLTGAIRVAGANDYRFTTNSGTDDLGTNPNIAIASGDELSFTAIYEIA